MISSILKLASIACIVAIALSFAAFASDEAGDESDKSVARIAYADSGGAPVARDSKTLNQPGPPRRVERMREKDHAGWREAVDDANDVLTAPFTALVSDSTIWGQRLVTSLLALVVFGFGLGFAARMLALRGV